MKFNMPHLAAALLLCGLATQASASGSVVFDSYGPDIDMLEGWPTPLFAGQDIAVAFELGSATSIESILTAIDGIGGVTLGIVARNGALPDGSGWLYSTHLADPVASTTVTPTGWALAAGSYWLMAVADAGFSGQWQSGTDSPNGSWAYSSGGAWTAVDSPFTGAPATRISVTSAVPEPASYALLLAGGLLLAAARRPSRNRQE